MVWNKKQNFMRNAMERLKRRVMFVGKKRWLTYSLYARGTIGIVRDSCALPNDDFLSGTISCLHVERCVRRG